MILNIIKKILQIKTRCNQYIYTKKIQLTCKEFGKNLTVNSNSKVTKNTYLLDNVNFNGMKIKGNAKINIGNNFHLGEEYLMITDIHNYDTGTSIPYDNTYIKKILLLKTMFGWEIE